MIAKAESRMDIGLEKESAMVLAAGGGQSK
jgi:hypothetical protein